MPLLELPDVKTLLSPCSSPGLLRVGGLLARGLRLPEAFTKTLAVDFALQDTQLTTAIQQQQQQQPEELLQQRRGEPEELQQSSRQQQQLEREDQRQQQQQQQVLSPPDPSRVFPAADGVYTRPLSPCVSLLQSSAAAWGPQASPLRGDTQLLQTEETPQHCLPSETPLLLRHEEHQQQQIVLQQEQQRLQQQPRLEEETDLEYAARRSPNRQLPQL